MGEQHQNVHDAFVEYLNQTYENVTFVCDQVDMEFRRLQGFWPLLHSYWSHFKVLSLNLSEEGVQHIVVYDVERTVEIQPKRDNEIWVYCVTIPEVDYGRVICIRGPVGKNRPVFLSKALRKGERNHPNIKDFNTPLLGMDGKQAWVTAGSYIIYFMDPNIYAYNLERVNDQDARQRAATLGIDLLALKNQLDALVQWAQQDVVQGLQHYYAQNQMDIQNVEPTHEDEDNVLLDEILEGQGGQNQEDIQELVNSLDIDQNTVVKAPVQVNECLDNCNKRIEKSYQQIVRLLQELHQLCEKRNRFEKELPHAVNILIGDLVNPKGAHLFKRREGTMSQSQ